MRFVVDHSTYALWEACDETSASADSPWSRIEDGLAYSQEGLSEGEALFLATHDKICFDG